MADEKLPPAPPPLPGETAPDYVRRITATAGTPVLRAATPTAETQILGPAGKKVVQSARAWAQALGILVAALAAAIPLLVGAYRSAVEEARVRAQAAAAVAAAAAKVDTQKVKNESEAGYQVARPVIEEYDRRLRALESGSPSAHRHSGRPRPASPPPKVVLPSDLAQALKVVTKAAGAPAPAPPEFSPAAPPDAGRSGVP